MSGKLTAKVIAILSLTFVAAVAVAFVFGLALSLTLNAFEGRRSEVSFFLPLLFSFVTSLAFVAYFVNFFVARRRSKGLEGTEPGSKGEPQ